MKPLKVCIVGLKCFDHIAGSPVPRYLGGIETQLVALARGLVKEDCEVSLITYDQGQADEEHFDGVRVLKSFSATEGVRLLRSVHPRGTGLWRAMNKADADIYLQMGAGSETGQVALVCRMSLLRRKHSVFCLASDANFGADLAAGRFGWEGKAYQYGLRNADLVVAQTLRQRDGLRRATGVESQVIPMAAASPSTEPTAHVERHGSNRVLWVGRIIPGKRLEWLLEAARRCPEISFDIVGTPNKPSKYATGLIASAAGLPNVNMHGRLAGSELSKLYQSCQVLCCTSTLEGFPTTFLEAWSCGMPVITTFDPDDVVARHNLGRLATDLDSVVSHLRDVLDNVQTYEHISHAARRYFSENHTVEKVSRRFRAAFQHLTSES